MKSKLKLEVLSIILVSTFISSICCIGLCDLTNNEIKIEQIKPISAQNKIDHNIFAENCIWEFQEIEDKIYLFIKVTNVTVTNDTVFGGNPANGTKLNDIQLKARFTLIDIEDQNQTRAEDYFYFNPSDSSFNYSIDLTQIPETDNMLIRTNFTYTNMDAYAIEETISFSLQHKVVISFVIAYVDGQKFASISTSSVKSTYKGEILTNQNCKIATYSLRDKDTKIEVNTGNLTFNTDLNYWTASIEMKGLAGDYYVVLTFKPLNLKNASSTIDEWDSTKNLIHRNFSILDYSIYILIGVGIIFGFIAIILTQKSKKQEKSTIERSKPEIKKELEIVEIKKGSLQIQKLDTKAQKKVKKLDEKGLIFNVPTWEVEEDTEQGTESSQIGTEKIKQVFTLHCPGCNSWYEVDDYEKLECPKCTTPLEVAMWCGNCEKWFDVPEPMDVDCPKCAQKLLYAK